MENAIEVKIGNDMVQVWTGAFIDGAQTVCLELGKAGINSATYMGISGPIVYPRLFVAPQDRERAIGVINQMSAIFSSGVVDNGKSFRELTE